MRVGDFEGGMVWFIPDHTPGLMLMNSFLSTSADQEYGGNWAHIKNPAVDNLIYKVITARTEQDFLAATRALDRVLLWNFYFIPGMSRVQAALVWWDKFGRPEQPVMKRQTALDTWWWDEAKAARVAARVVEEQ